MTGEIEPRPANPEMVAVARGWVEQRVQQWLNGYPIEAWALLVARELQEIAQYDAIGGNDDQRD